MSNTTRRRAPESKGFRRLSGGRTCRSGRALGSRKDQRSAVESAGVFDYVADDELMK